MKDIIAFIEAHDPGFSSKIVGADPSTIDALEARCGRKLPRSYREFLLAMGEAGGGFDVYPGYAYRASELVRFAPEASELGYDPKEFLKVAVNLATDLDNPADGFLDLRRASADDAPLVSFWDTSGLPLEERADTVFPTETGYWIHDMLRLSALRQYDLDPREHRARMAVTSPLRDDGELVGDQEAWWRDVVRLLDQWQWHEPLKGHAFRAVESDGTTVVAERVERPPGPIIVRIASEDRGDLVRRMEMIHDTLHVVLQDGRDETLLAPID